MRTALRREMPCLRPTVMPLGSARVSSRRRKLRLVKVELKLKTEVKTSSVMTVLSWSTDFPEE